MCVWQYYFNSKYCKLRKFIYIFFYQYWSVNYMTGTVLSHVKDLGIYHGSNKKIAIF